MKSKTFSRVIAASAAVVCTAFTAVAQETAEGIAKKFDTEKAAALEAYLKGNPDAKDRDQAIGILISVRTALGENEQVAGLLKERYSTFDKEGTPDLNVLIGEIVAPLLGALMESGQKDEAKAFAETVRKDLGSNQMAPQIGQFLDGFLSQMDQKPAPQVGDVMEIAFTSAGGEEIDLAKMKDKVVLVDFWATWCGPCVAEMPNVVKAYNDFNGKGFEVIGISLDEDKDAMVKFAAERKMPWPQYFDGKVWENDLAVKFGIRGIPATFLIGKDGKVAATDLRGSALEEKIVELLK